MSARPSKKVQGNCREGEKDGSTARARRESAGDHRSTGFHTPCKWRCAARWRPAWAPSLIGWSAGSRGGPQTPSSSVDCGRDQSTAGSADQGHHRKLTKRLHHNGYVTNFNSWYLKLKLVLGKLYLESHDEDAECIQDGQTHFSGDVSLQQRLVQHVCVRVAVGWRQ